MVIRKSRIRRLAPHLGAVPPNTPVRFGVPITSAIGPRLEELGLGASPSVGDTVLPAPVGPVSRFNAHGKEIVRHDLPMETAYRQREWSWTEWHGRARVERTGIVDVPYQRYPRDFVPPPSVELEVVTNPAEALYVVVGAEPYDDAHHDSLVHKANLLLEIFGECEVLRDDAQPFIRAPQRRLNWEVLPAGELPWEQVRTAVEPIVTRERPGNRPPIWTRFQAIQRHRPDFHALGRGGFRGYVVFGFERLGLYVLESAHYGNATYLLDRDWEHLSQLTKAELLNQDLHHARIIHRAHAWRRQLDELIQAAANSAAA